MNRFIPAALRWSSPVLWEGLSAEHLYVPPLSLFTFGSGYSSLHSHFRQNRLYCLIIKHLHPTVKFYRSSFFCLQTPPEPACVLACPLDSTLPIIPLVHYQRIDQVFPVCAGAVPDDGYWVNSVFPDHSQSLHLRV